MNVFQFNWRKVFLRKNILIGIDDVDFNIMDLNMPNEKTAFVW